MKKSGPFLTKMGPKVDFAPGAYRSAAIKDGEFHKALKKLFKSHPKDFAVRQKIG